MDSVPEPPKSRHVAFDIPKDTTEAHSTDDPVPATPAENTAALNIPVRQKPSDLHEDTSSTVPYGISHQCQITVVVGLVHSNMSPQNVSLALGYRPHRKNKGFSHKLLYTWEQVMEVFVHLEKVDSISLDVGRDSIYRRYGPSYQTAPKEYRVSKESVEIRQALIEEALRRLEYVEEMRKLAQKELKTRHKIMSSIGLYEDGELDEKDGDLYWEGMAQRDYSKGSSGRLPLIL